MSKLFGDLTVSVPVSISDHSFGSEQSFATAVVSTIVWVIGVASVIMVVVGALMYVTSAGDATKTARAKDAIVYAVVGVVIAMLGWGIITFIKGKFI